MPNPRNYKKWVAEVKITAEEVEGMSDYRPKGAHQIITKMGPSKSGSAHIFFSSNPSNDINEEGDTRMGRTDAILAAIKDLKLHQNSSALANFWNKKDRKVKKHVGQNISQSSKPRTPW